MPVASTARAVVSRYVDALQRGDEPAVRGSFAEDATWTLEADLPMAGTWRGRDVIVDEFLAAALDRFAPGSLAIDVTGLVAEKDVAVLSWTTRGRTRRGAEYVNDCIGVFRVRDGLIVAVREYMDTLRARTVLFGAPAA